MASKIRGVAKTRRLLKRLPEEMRAEMIGVLQRIGAATLGAARRETPTRSGLGRSLLAYKVYPKSLRLRMGLLTKKQNSRAFYLHILDVGRKAQTVTVTRKKGVAPYKLRVSPIAAGKFDIVYGRTRALAKRLAGGILGGIYKRALTKAAGGGGYD